MMQKSKQPLKATIYHNSKCSKSNAALNLLIENGLEAGIVDYLETPLSSTQLETLLNQLGIEAKALIRFGEPIAKELGISVTDTREEDEWLSFMAEYPVLIERPVVLINGKAVIGRPIEKILALVKESRMA